ncbi:hypothetical protein scyTo_0011418 [Scyliorhinus torazame]|uniref:Potassium channel domain-containing protein n=1 Tax=Scyliorhinus torazame TaxID=75743 RepID=A0A401NME2_SCYTO|nr:hypothetical protein [Scyliorhinus torazame]
MHRNRSICYFLLLALAYLLYLSFGALIFSSVELPYEDNLRQELRQLKSRFLEENPCLAQDSLERFLDRVLEANNYGVSVLNNSTGKWNWDFTSSLFFATTVLTTTGNSERETPHSYLGIPSYITLLKNPLLGRCFAASPNQFNVTRW